MRSTLALECSATSRSREPPLSTLHPNSQRTIGNTLPPENVLTLGGWVSASIGTTDRPFSRMVWLPAQLVRTRTHVGHQQRCSQRLRGLQNSTPPHPKPTLDTSCAAAFAKSFSTPVDRLKLYMACQDVSAPTPYRGLWDAARDMTSKFGVTALWRGHPGVLIRYIPSQVLNFVVFCALAPRLGLHDQLPGRRRAAHGAQPTTLHPVLSAATAGAAASACTLALTYPTSVARGALVADRVKAAKESTGNGLRSGFAGLVREVRETAGRGSEGAGGASPALLRSFGLCCSRCRIDGLLGAAGVES
jgi:hypothetical protein